MKNRKWPMHQIGLVILMSLGGLTILTVIL